MCYNEAQLNVCGTIKDQAVVLTQTHLSKASHTVPHPTTRLAPVRSHEWARLIIHLKHVYSTSDKAMQKPNRHTQTHTAILLSHKGSVTSDKLSVHF